MITVTATNFRTHLFEYLDKVASGEMIVIQRNNQEIARVIPLTPPDWRAKMTTKMTINVSPEALMEPIEDVWDDYL